MEPLNQDTPENGDYTAKETLNVGSDGMGKWLRMLALLGERERAHLVVQLARFFYICIVRVPRYRIASKCFYAFLFRRPRGEKYRNNCVWIEAEAPLGSTVDCKHSGLPPQG